MTGFWRSFREALGPAAPLLDGIIDYARQIWQWFSDILGPVEASGEQWLSWGQNAGAALGEVISNVTEWNNKTGGLIGTLAKLWAGFLALRLIWRIPLAPIRMAGALLAWVAKSPVKWLLTGISLIGKAFIRLGVLMLANPVGLVIATIAALAYVVYDNWDRIVSFVIEKVDAVKAAFDEGLLNGVFKLLAEFNPFTLAVEGMQGLIAYVMDLLGVPQEIVSAFRAINLFEAGVSIIQSLWDGMLSLIDQVVASIVAKFASLKPQWLSDLQNWIASDNEAAPIVASSGSGYGNGPISMREPADVAVSSFATLPPEQRAATKVIREVISVGELPTDQYMARLEAAAQRQRQIIADLRADLAANPTDDNYFGSVLDGRDNRLAAAEQQLKRLTTEQEKARTRADELQRALMVINQTNIRPDVDATSIDQALAKAAKLATLLHNGSGATMAASEVVPAGARDRGGPVRAGFPYLVGERDEEIFVPGVSGSILPTRVLKAAMAASAISAPVAAMPAQSEMIERFDRRPAISAPSSAPQITRQGDTFNITIAPPPGTDEQTIIRLLKRELAARQNARRADLHDGVDY